MPIPDFLIAGERRCGTTTLARWIAAHDDVFMLPQMDIAYFVDSAVVGTRKWFDGAVDESKWQPTHSLHDYSRLFDDVGDRQAFGEKSADYLFWRPAHARIAACLPDVKLVIALRHPVERAWSHYWNEVGKGRESLDFEAALEQEEERCARSDYALDHLSYQKRGCYDESLRALFQHVPRNRVLVTTLEQMRREPVNALREVYGFLGVDPDKGLDRAGEQFNANWTTIPRRWARLPVLSALERLCVDGFEWGARKCIRNLERRRRFVRRVVSTIRDTKSDMRMECATRRELSQSYAPHVRELESLLNRSFDDWQLT